MREEMTTLGESCQFFNGKAHEKDIDAEGAYVVVNSKFISRDGKVRKYTGKQMFPLFEDDIVMVMSDVPNGKALAKCYIIEENDKYSLNQRICSIRTKEFDIRFLYYQLNRHPYFLAFNNGENQSNLRKGDILNCPLWKPSVEIQEQIVELLDETLEQIEQSKYNIEKNIKNTKELFQSKLYDFFSQKGKGWVEKTLGELGEVQTGTTPSTKDKSNYGDYIAFAKPPHFQVNGGIDTKDSMLSKKGLEKGRLFKANSTLMVCIGATIGKTGFSENPISSNQQINALTPNENYIPKLLYYALISPFVQKQVMAVGKNAQATLPIINKSKWLKLKVNLPIDKSIQNQIIDTLEDLKEFCIQTEFNYQKKLTNLEDFKNSILQKAFAGELTEKAIAV